MIRFERYQRFKDIKDSGVCSSINVLIERHSERLNQWLDLINRKISTIREFVARSMIRFHRHSDQWLDLIKDSGVCSSSMIRFERHSERVWKSITRNEQHLHFFEISSYEKSTTWSLLQWWEAPERKRLRRMRRKRPPWQPKWPLLVR
jgi:hypothetical protein